MSRQSSGDDGDPNPLLKLPPNRQEELIAAYERFEDSDAADDPEVNRRGVLAGIATLLTGSAIGGGAYALSTEEVAAATAAVGQVGEPGNTVDVYGDAVTANSVDTDELRGIADVIIKTSDSYSDAQTKLDDAGSNSTVWFEPGDYSGWISSPVKFYSQSTIYWLGSDVSPVDGYTGAGIKPVDTTNGTDNVTLYLYGSDFDGKRSTLTAGDDSDGLKLRGDDGSTDNTDNFSTQLNVYGGTFHDWRRNGVWVGRVLNSTIEIEESYNNGEPGNTSQGGDGIYVANSKGVTARCPNVHDNERHGFSLQGEQTGYRCIDVTFEGVAEDNGNKGLGVYGCENFQADVTARRNGMGDALLKGTGWASVSSKNSMSYGVLTRVVDYSGNTSIITGETDDSQAVRLEVEVEGASSDGVQIGDDAVGAVCSLPSPVINNVAGYGINQQDRVTMNVSNPDIQGTDSGGINLGNNTAIEETSVTGGRVDDYDRNSNDVAAINSGSLGNRATVSGVSVGSRGGTNAPAVSISGGDYHAVVGVASQGKLISVNGSNSTTAGNN